MLPRLVSPYPLVISLVFRFPPIWPSSSFDSPPPVSREFVSKSILFHSTAGSLRRCDESRGGPCTASHASGLEGSTQDYRCGREGPSDVERHTGTPENTGELPPERPAYEGPSISIEQEMRTSYLDYAMSVIVSRAIPDLRERAEAGAPAHSLRDARDHQHLRQALPQVRPARGRHDGQVPHPHGDSAIYDALVRMAQPFSDVRCRFSDGQGQLRLDGPATTPRPCATPRSGWPARPSFLLADIEKDTVDFQDNYGRQGPRAHRPLPARFPNMLVNGAGGIAGGHGHEHPRPTTSARSSTPRSPSSRTPTSPPSG